MEIKLQQRLERIESKLDRILRALVGDKGPSCLALSCASNFPLGSSLALVTTLGGRGCGQPRSSSAPALARIQTTWCPEIRSGSAVPKQWVEMQCLTTRSLLTCLTKFVVSACFVAITGWCFGCSAANGRRHTLAELWLQPKKEPSVSTSSQERFMADFQPDGITSDPSGTERNDTLRELLRGIWHDKAIVTIRRIEADVENGTQHGWEAIFNDPIVR